MSATLVLAMPACASAGVRPLAPRAANGSAPALGGGSVFISTLSSDGGIAVRGFPATGGPARPVAQARLPKRSDTVEGWSLAAGPTGLGLRVSGDTRGQVLFGGPALGPLRTFSTRVPRVTTVAAGANVWVSTAGVVTLERAATPRGRLSVRTGDGRSRVIALPAGADPRVADVSGATVAVALVRKGGGLTGVALVDIASGAVTRRIRGGDLNGFSADSIGLGPDGSVALTGDDGIAEDGRIGYAAAGETTLTAIFRGNGLREARPSAGRVAVIANLAPDSEPSPGQRVLVIRPRPGSDEGAVRYRGPRASEIAGLSFDGATASWGTGGCQVVSDTDPRSSARILPSGPCVRSEVSTQPGPPVLRGRARGYRLAVRCVIAPGRFCRLRVAAQDPRGRLLARGGFRVRRGTRASLRLPIPSRRLRRALETGSQVFYDITVIDPDGRRRTELAP